MRIVFTASGLFFSGKAGDFRRFLAGLPVVQPLSEYLRRKLR